MALATLTQRFRSINPWGHRRVEVAPPLLTDGKRFPYGPFQFRTQLPKDTEYTILASPDFQHWAPIHRGEAIGESCDYFDAEAFKHSYRFYRLQVEEILSSNVIGYASVTLPPGFSMLANPLEGPANTVAQLFQGWPDGTTLNKFDTRLFRLAENTVKFGKWTNPNEKLFPGEGAMFFNPTCDYRSLSFVGNVMQEHLSVPIPSGFSIRSSLVPLPGNLEDLGFPIADGDVIHLYDRDRQKYVLYPYEGKKWKDGPPIVSVGESFWVAKTEPGNWVQTLSANDE